MKKRTHVEDEEKKRFLQKVGGKKDLFSLCVNSQKIGYEKSCRMK
jgi:hypothetical protein